MRLAQLVVLIFLSMPSHAQAPAAFQNVEGTNIEWEPCLPNKLYDPSQPTDAIPQIFCVALGKTIPSGSNGIVLRTIRFEFTNGQNKKYYLRNDFAMTTEDSLNKKAVVLFAQVLGENLLMSDVFIYYKSIDDYLQALQLDRKQPVSAIMFDGKAPSGERFEIDQPFVLTPLTK